MMRVVLVDAAAARNGSGPEPRQRAGSWLRWLPAPLAVLAALVGWLVLASLPGQAHDGHDHGYQAGGLALAVSQMLWMSNDMGDGPVPVPTGYQMPDNMMPGMQAAGDDRLRLEVQLTNVSSRVQQYAPSEFEVVAPGGQSWQALDDGGYDATTVAALQPGFAVTVDMYFDIPAKQITNLTVTWSRGGSTVRFPVKIGVPSPHVH